MKYKINQETVTVTIYKRLTTTETSRMLNEMATIERYTGQDYKWKFKSGKFKEKEISTVA